MTRAMRWMMYVMCATGSLASSAALSAAEAPAPKVQATEFESKTIYHSPQAPGYTAWCTLWSEAGSDTSHPRLRLAFQQVTGPVERWQDRKNVTVILGSDDAGQTWIPLRQVSARTSKPSVGDEIYAAPGSSAFCGHGLAVLTDGALITGLWPTGADLSGYLQRSTDGGKTWSKPIYFLDPSQYKTYPTQIRQLRDGRLILVAGLVKQADATSSPYLLKGFFESGDGGRSWKQIWTMPRDVGLCEESDFVELDSGDLLFVHRAEHYDGTHYVGSDRLQTIFHSKGSGWEIGPTTPLPIPHSGFPELLKTRQGIVLHIATDGVWQTGDGGATWSKLDLPGSPYYPRATQLPDGRILVVGHIGGDDGYGKVDQSIVQQTFRLEVSSPASQPAPAAAH